MASELGIHSAASKETQDGQSLGAEGLDLDDLDLEYDSLDESGENERPAERWAPLGAAVSPTPPANEIR